jgi:hypothetical protein
MGGPNGMEGKEGFWNIHTNYNGARRSFGSHNHMHEKSTSMLQRKKQSLAKVMILVVYFYLFQRKNLDARHYIPPSNLSYMFCALHGSSFEPEFMFCID